MFGLDVLVVVALIAVLIVLPRRMRAAAERRNERLGRSPEPPRPGLVATMAAMLIVGAAVSAGVFTRVDALTIGLFVLLACSALFFFARELRRRLGFPACGILRGRCRRRTWRQSARVGKRG
jgi:hypothetical protein